MSSRFDTAEDFLLLKKRPFRDRSFLFEGLSRASGHLVGVVQSSRQTASLDAPVCLLLKRQSGKSLERFSQPIVQRSYSSMRRSLEALLAAGFLGRLFMGCMPEREADESIYDLLSHLYDALDEGEDARVCGLWGQDRLLQALGLAPHLDDCVLCQKKEVVGFSALEGGVLCPDCYDGKGMVVNGQVLQWCRRLREASLRKLAADEMVPSNVRAAGLIFKAQFQTHLELGSTFFKRVLPPRKGGTA